MTELKRTHIDVDAGAEANTYATGDMLNAINDVVCYFRERRQIEDTAIAAALRMYADAMEASGV